MAAHKKPGEYVPYDEPQDAPASRVQESFLRHIQRQRAPVTVFLVNGVKLQGVVPSFDENVLILRRDGHAQLVYKHAISTIMPISPITLFSEEEGENGVVAESA